MRLWFVTLFDSIFHLPWYTPPLVPPERPALPAERPRRSTPKRLSRVTSHLKQR